MGGRGALISDAIQGIQPLVAVDVAPRAGRRFRPLDVLAGHGGVRVLLGVAGAPAGGVAAVRDGDDRLVVEGGDLRIVGGGPWRCS